MADSDLADNVLTPLWLETEAGVISGLQAQNASQQQGAQTPLTLLLHGAGGGARSLAKLGQFLQVPGTLLIPDLQGYGKTRLNPEVTAGHNALTQHRMVIDSLLQTYCQPEQPVVIIGHSMGGLLSLLTTLSQQWPVAKLAAIEPMAFSVLESAEDKAIQDEDLANVMALDAALKGRGDPAQALADFIAYWNGVAWDKLPEPMQAVLLKQVERIGTDALAVAQDTTPAELYRDLDLPVLLIQGELSPAPAKVVIQRLGELLPRVETRLVEGMRHMGAVQQPEVFAGVINEFLLGRNKQAVPTC